jgi:hypothetical protein
MELFSPHTRQFGVDQRPRGTLMDSLPMIRTGGMALLAMVLAVTLANLVCG